MSKIQKRLDKIIVTLVTVLVISFIIPTYSHAKWLDSVLADGFQTFICYLCDGVMNIGEKYFGQSDIRGIPSKDLLENDGIKYGVGSIVSGKLASFDINFFDGGKSESHQNQGYRSYALNQMYDKVEKELSAYIDKYNDEQDKEVLDVAEEIEKIMEEPRYIDTGNVANKISTFKDMYLGGISFGELLRGGNGSNMDLELIDVGIATAWGKEYPEQPDIFESDFFKIFVEKSSKLNSVTKDLQIIYYIDEDNNTINKEKLMSEFRKIKPVIQKYYETDGDTQKIAVNALSPIVSKFYSSLRMIAIVALLSVMVYIGIKIVISSTANDKAKYKHKLMNVVVAICLLFMMHYIMKVSLYICEIFSDAIGTEIVTDSGEDVLMTAIRNKADISKSTKSILAYTLIYAVLVVLTTWFTVVYIKRILTMILLTIIAPLVTVTYPIDKEKDGKAQAFGFWLREYMFNILIQPIHLILYYVFVQSTMDLVEKGNFFWAIAVLWFMMKAEKIVRSMFKLDSSSTLPNSKVSFAGGMAAAAAVRRLAGKAKGLGRKGLNAGKSSEQDPKIRQKDPEEYNENNNIRQSNIDDTTTQDSSSQNASNQNINGQDTSNQNISGQDTSNQNISGQNSNSQDISRSTQNNSTSSGNTVRANNIQNGNEQKDEKGKNKKDPEQKKIEKSEKKTIKGAKKQAKRRGRKAVARKIFKGKNIAKVAKGAAHIGLGAAGGTIGLAAAIASGDTKNIDNFVARGVGAGVGVASLGTASVKGVANLGRSAKKQVTDIKDTYKIGANEWDSKQYQQEVLIPRIKKKNGKNKDIQDKYQRELGSIEFLESEERDELYNAGIIDEDMIIKAIKQKQRDKISNFEMVQNTLIAARIKDIKDLEVREKQLRKSLSERGYSGKNLDKATNIRMDRIKELSGIH